MIDLRLMKIRDTAGGEHVFDLSGIELKLASSQQEQEIEDAVRRERQRRVEQAVKRGLYPNPRAPAFTDDLKAFERGLIFSKIVPGTRLEIIKELERVSEIRILGPEASRSD